MSYVESNTGNNLGRRGLGRLARLGWDNPPYPVYRQPRSMTRLNGEFNPAGPDSSTSAAGAITYRIDPRTGRYNFYRTDIKPRGVFMQNTFQHPAPPVMSALGITIQRGRTSAEPRMRLLPALTLSGLGCDCGGSCNGRNDARFAGRRRRGLGVDPTSDTFVDTNTGCVVDTDGNLLTCPIGPGGAQQPTKASGPTDPALLQQLISAGQQIVTGAGPRVVVQQPAASWFDQKTNVGGMLVSNPVLAAGAVGFAFLLAGMGGKRR